MLGAGYVSGVLIDFSFLKGGDFKNFIPAKKKKSMLFSPPITLLISNST